MAFPDDPSFDDGGPGAVWWRARSGDALYVCSTGANTFVRLLQQRLRELAPRAGVEVDAKWGAHTQAGLVTALQAVGAPGPLVAAAQADANLARVGSLRTGARIPGGSYAGAVFLLHRNPVDAVPAALDAASLVVPAGTTLPKWNVAPPLDSIPETGVRCALQGVETPPGPPAPPPPVVPPPTGVQVESGPVEAGSTVPHETTGAPTPVPPGQSLQLPVFPGVPVPGLTRATPAVSTGLIVGAVVAVGVLGLLVYSTRKLPGAK